MAGTQSIVYTSPAGIVTLLKDGRFYNPGPNPAELYVTLYRVAGDIGVNVAIESMGVAAVFDLAPWIVLEPSDELRLFSTGNQIVYWLSGALLPQPTT